MEVRAVAKFVRVQPRKVRIVAANLRGQSAAHAATLLRFHPSKSARVLGKVVLSAIANAQENLKLSQENLRIREVRIDEGPVMKRIQARAMGRANRILKRMSHITVVVEDFEPAPPVKKHGTSPKPRPKFEAPKRAGKKSAAPTTGAPVAETGVESPMEGMGTTEPANAENTAAAEGAAQPTEGSSSDVAPATGEAAMAPEATVEPAEPSPGEQEADAAPSDSEGEPKEGEGA
jgi:large subunit ribosomal protein L22